MNAGDRGPNSLAVCTFLDRTSRRIVQVPVNFRCFEIPDRFVVGWGLDYSQLYRNLNYVAVISTSRETADVGCTFLRLWQACSSPTWGAKFQHVENVGLQRNRKR